MHHAMWLRIASEMKEKGKKEDAKQFEKKKKKKERQRTTKYKYTGYITSSVPRSRIIL